MRNVNTLIIPLVLFFLFSLYSCTPPVTETDSLYYSEQTEPSQGDWLIIHLPVNPDNLNPLLYRQTSAGNILQLLFQAVVAVHPDDYSSVPQVAKKLYTVSEDGLSFDFELREEATWDDGSPITGHDIAFSYKALKNPLVNSTHLKGFYSFVEDIIVNEENPKLYTVVVNTKYFLSGLSIADLFLLPKYHYDPNGLMDKFSIPDLNAKSDELTSDPDIIAFAEEFNSDKYMREAGYIVGSGPYEFVEWVTGTQVKLQRKKDWWGDKVEDERNIFDAWPETIVYRVITDNSTSMTALKSQEIDIHSSIPAKEYLEFLDNELITKNYNLLTADLFTVLYLGLNNRPTADRLPFFTDKKVRNAIAHLVDVDKIINTVYYGMGSRTTGPILPMRGEDEYNVNLKPKEIDVEKAKALLEEAGWTDSNGDGVRDKMIDGKLVEFNFELMTIQNRENTKMMALIMQEYFEQAGLQITIVEHDFTTNATLWRDHKFDAFIGGFAGSPIPSDLKQVWHSESWVNNGYNYFGFGNAESDKVIDAIRTEFDPEKRKVLYYRIQEIMYDEQPVVFMMVPKIRMAFHKRFRGGKATALRPGFTPNNFWVPKNLIKYSQQ